MSRSKNLKIRKLKVAENLARRSKLTKKDIKEFNKKIKKIRNKKVS
jgi:hypothetical protein